MRGTGGGLPDSRRLRGSRFGWYRQAAMCLATTVYSITSGGFRPPVSNACSQNK